MSPMRTGVTRELSRKMNHIDTLRFAERLKAAFLEAVSGTAESRALPKPFRRRLLNVSYIVQSKLEILRRIDRTSYVVLRAKCAPDAAFIDL